MSRISQFSTELATRNLDHVSQDCRRGDVPARWFIQETLWALWLEQVDSLLGGPELPSVVRVGRNGFIVPVSCEDWLLFQEELGCHQQEVREEVGRLLGSQLLGTPISVSRRLALTDSILGLILLLCGLDQRERAGQLAGFEFNGNLADFARRHPTPSGFGPLEAIPTVEMLVDYAGLQTSKSGPLKRAYYSLYRPLRRRLAGRRWIPPDAAPPELTLDFLREALVARCQPPNSVEEAIPSELPQSACTGPVDEFTAGIFTTCETPPENQREVQPVSQIGLGALAGLLKPVLLSQRDPLEVARAAPIELGRRMCRAVVDFLQDSNVEWYGRPGDYLDLSLPNSDWQLDERAAAPSDATVLRRYRVTRWGLRLYGRVISPARVVPDLESL